MNKKKLIPVIVGIAIILIAAVILVVCLCNGTLAGSIQDAP